MKTLEHLIREIATRSHEYTEEKTLSLEHTIRNIHEISVKTAEKAAEVIFANPSTKGKELVVAKPKTITKSKPKTDIDVETKTKEVTKTEPEVKTDVKTDVPSKTETPTKTPTSPEEPIPHEVAPKGEPEVKSPTVVAPKTGEAPKQESPKTAPVEPKAGEPVPPTKGGKKVLPIPFGFGGRGGGIYKAPFYYDKLDDVPEKLHLSVAKPHKKFRIKEETRKDIEVVARSGEDRKRVEYVGRHSPSQKLTRQSEYKKKIIDEGKKVVNIIKNARKEKKEMLDADKTITYPNVIIHPEEKRPDQGQ